MCEAFSEQTGLSESVRASPWNKDFPRMGLHAMGEGGSLQNFGALSWEDEKLSPNPPTVFETIKKTSHWLRRDFSQAQANRPKKQAGVAALITDKTGFTSKLIRRHREGH